MGGYILLFSDDDSMRECMRTGVYATRLNTGSPYWGIPQEGTFADYASMRPGDSVFFFRAQDRRIWGIGELVEVGGDVVHLNFPGASEPGPADPDAGSMLLDDTSQRWLCTFRPAPAFFRTGVDMDEVLTSHPSAFRMLRALWKVSFLKIDDEETQALKDILLRRNLEALPTPGPDASFDASEVASSHDRIGRITAGSEGYRLSSSPLVRAATLGTGVRHEMALEAALIRQLTEGDTCTTATLGEWDYLSHQVIASPFKPIDYMDRIDVFGYRFVPDHRPTRAAYLVAEVKKGVASAGDLAQLLKYVDYVAAEYAGGDYAMIRAALIAQRFSLDWEAEAQAMRRHYTVGTRPPVHTTWESVRLVQYKVSEGDVALQATADRWAT